MSRDFTVVMLARIATGMAVFFLVIGLGPWHVGYYRFLELIVFLAALFSSHCLFSFHKILAMAVIVAAAIYNPVAHAPLAFEIWPYMDIVSAFLLGTAAFRLKPTQSSQ